MALVTLSYGRALPSDDLLRHLSSWELNFDYRAQYPWADLPRTNLWLGYDYVLGLLQRLGLSKDLLLVAIPGLLLASSAHVLYRTLRVTLKGALSAEWTLVLFALGLYLVTPRTLLGRPDAVFAVFSASAMLANSSMRRLAWTIGYLCLIPFYWLGWAYAAFALLLPGRALVPKIVLAAGLAIAHLAFWQIYSTDYLRLMLWLQDTLWLKASENEPLLVGAASFAGLAFMVLLSAAVAIRASRLLGRASRLGVWRSLALAPAGVCVGLVVVWLSLPNQIRYLSAIAFAALPWSGKVLLGYFRLVKRRLSRGSHNGFGGFGAIPHVPIVCLLFVAGLQQVPLLESAPSFKLEASARVLSEQPYAAVFHGAVGIAVEPSFALGATHPQWRKILDKGRLDCARTLQAGFTYVVEKSLIEIPACLELKQVEGAWRLWSVR